MPAHRKRLKRFRNTLKKKRGKKPFLRLAVFFLALLFSILFLAFGTYYWDDEGKLAMVVGGEGEDVVVGVFDTQLERITSIVIPADTQVEVARQLGSWRIGSVWKLGENERLKGKLLAETLVKQFKLPVVAWADKPARIYFTGKFFPILKLTFLPFETNLRLGDRIRMGIFSIRVKNMKKEVIDLSKTTSIKEGILADGERGYRVVGKTPAFLKALFSDPLIAEKNAKALIINKTGSINLPHEVGEVVEVMGAKIASIRNEEEEGFDCVVLAKDKQIARKISQPFSCKTEGEQPEGAFDIEIRLGKDFARRF